MCDKLIYDSFRLARQAINHAKNVCHGGRRYRHRKKKVIPEDCYYCKNCHGWHLTSLKTNRFKEEERY